MPLRDSHRDSSQTEDSGSIDAPEIAHPTRGDSELRNDRFHPPPKPDSYRDAQFGRVPGSIMAQPLAEQPVDSTGSNDSRFKLVCIAVVVVTLAIIVAVAVVVGITLNRGTTGGSSTPGTVTITEVPIPATSTPSAPSTPGPTSATTTVSTRPVVRGPNPEPTTVGPTSPSPTFPPTMEQTFNPAASGEVSYSATLESVRNDVFRCGITRELVGFSTSVNGGAFQGFEVDLVSTAARMFAHFILVDRLNSFLLPSAVQLLQLSLDQILETG